MLAEKMHIWDEELKLEARLNGEARLLHRVLKRRFGPLPRWVQAKLSKATEKDLLRWADSILDAPALKQVFTR